MTLKQPSGYMVELSTFLTWRMKEVIGHKTLSLVNSKIMVNHIWCKVCAAHENVNQLWICWKEMQNRATGFHPGSKCGNQTTGMDFFIFFLVKHWNSWTALFQLEMEVVSYNSFSKFFCLLKANFEQANIKNIVIKWDINEASIEHFKSLFNSIDWDLVTQTSLLNHSYNIFLEKFVQIYDQAFPERKFEIKAKNLVSPWITRGLRRSIQDV